MKTEYVEKTEYAEDEICFECEGNNGDYVILCNYHLSLIAQVKELKEVLDRLVKSNGRLPTKLLHLLPLGQLTDSEDAYHQARITLTQKEPKL